MANVGQTISDGNVTWIVRDIKAEATSITSGLMSAADKKKLDEYPAKTTGNTKYLREDGTWVKPELEIETDTYSLPKASANTLGGILIGNNLTVDSDGRVGVSLSGNASHVLRGNGTWEAIGSYSLETASTSNLGGVKIGTNTGITIGSNGVISLSNASAGKIGGLSLPTASDATAELYLNALGNWTKPGFENDQNLYTIKLPGQTGYLEYETKWLLRPSWNGFDVKKMKMQTVPSASVTAYVRDTLGNGNYDNGVRKAEILLGCATGKARIDSRVSARFSGLHVVKFTPITPYKWTDGTSTAKMTHWLVHQRTLNFDLLPAQVVSFNNPLYLFYDTDDTNNYNDNRVKQIVQGILPGSDGEDVDDIITYDFETKQEVIDDDGQYQDAGEIPVADAEKEDSLRLYLFANNSLGTGSSITPDPDNPELGRYLHFKNIKQHLQKTDTEGYTNTSYMSSNLHERYMKIYCKEGSDKGVFQVLSIGHPESKGYRQESREFVVLAKKEENTFEFEDENLDYSLIELDASVNSASYNIVYDYDQPLYTANQVTDTNASIIANMLSPNGSRDNIAIQQGITVSPALAANASISSATRNKVFSDGSKTYYRYTKLTLKVHPNIASGTFTVTIRPPSSKVYLRPIKKVMKFVINADTSSRILSAAKANSDTACAAVKTNFVQDNAKNLYKIGDYIEFSFTRNIPLHKRISGTTEPKTSIERYHYISKDTVFKAVLIGINHFQNCPETYRSGSTDYYDTGNKTFVLPSGTTLSGSKNIGGTFCICKDENDNDIAFEGMMLQHNSNDYGYANVKMFPSLSPNIPDEQASVAVPDIEDQYKACLSIESAGIYHGYKDSPFDKWLNSTFFYSLPKQLRGIISASKVPCMSYELHIDTPALDSTTSEFVKAHLWLLAAAEYSSRSFTADAEERPMVKKYDYFALGNYVNKYCHDDPNTLIRYYMLTRTHRKGTSTDEGSSRRAYTAGAKPDSTKIFGHSINYAGGFCPCFII